MGKYIIQPLIVMGACSFLGVWIYSKKGGWNENAEIFFLKLYQHRPQIAKTNFWVINVKEKCPPNHSTLQWHPAMAPRPLPQSWLSPSPPP